MWRSALTVDKRSIGEVVREQLDNAARVIREQAERDLADWEAIPPQERERLLAQFTRPDGTLCDHWWQPEVEGWGKDMKRTRWRRFKCWIGWHRWPVPAVSGLREEEIKRCGLGVTGSTLGSNA